MRWLLLTVPAAAILLFALLGPTTSADTADKKPVGIDKRVPWTTSKVKGSPEPPAPYRSEVAFPKLERFAEPLDLAFIPGGNRLAVAERRGKILTFINDPATTKSDLLLQIKQAEQIYAVTFHPQFAKNGYVFVTYVIGDGKPNGTRMSRFEAKGEPPVADPATEKILFEWPSGGHNAGCLKFGPDGFLYIGTGDGSGIADELQTGQKIDDVRAKILRIDVDHHDAGKSYGIPKDNPFVGRAGARGEIWAYGIRQPWKFSFDRAGTDLWVGEVGQDLWESVLRIQKGGNYGWSVKEATHDFRPERTKGPDPILTPVYEHPHSEFRSLTGGFVYHGTRLKDLIGSYIYGDFDTGRIWRLRLGANKVEAEELTQTALRIVSFGEDQAGEIYYLDFAGGQLHRLVPAEKQSDAPPFPRKLSETGLFESTKDLKPAAGLIPYDVNAQLWSDGAIKDRYLALPGTSQIEFDAVVYPYKPEDTNHPRGWRFPDGTVAVKTFSLDLEPGNPKSRVRLETRLLHFENRPGTQEYGDGYWRGYTYEWNDDQTDAVLVDKAGRDRAFTIKDKGGDRKQTWHFPSRAECIGCHTMPAKFALGINTLQMNKEHDYGGGRVANQLRTLEHLGVFKTPLPKPPEMLPKLANYDDRKESLDARARAYLHSNCAHCHTKWGGGNADFELLATMAMKDTKALSEPVRHGQFELKNAALLAPGAPERSLMLYRMKRLDAPRMPRVGSGVVDENGVKLMEEWIKGMK